MIEKLRKNEKEEDFFNNCARKTGQAHERKKLNHYLKPHTKLAQNGLKNNMLD